ncbi:ADP-ribosylation/crystallin J1 [Flavivirga amylovorans]|uniref:ADP-ribosylation/crystallin J1 n=1 Tax=Flavivirga amylovorans TaxID=870486 RepID=A0ABT8X0E4_9FLAO|nr:ADP-ribosylation/crystallin J1 [Flavivirga amylovorans]MDO5987099.1 ADP-ribosylation/crystallin J1 [Flavivirga amylovorans]
MKTKTLYRPIGEKELILIAESDFKKFPPRLEWQPIFYPVLNELYACEIASQWNTKDEFGNYLGFVTAFEVTEEEFLKYKIENVGGSHHNELWVPSEELETFNKAIVGEIDIIKVFIGEKFKKAMHPIPKSVIDKLRNNEN